MASASLRRMQYAGLLVPILHLSHRQLLVEGTLLKFKEIKDWHASTWNAGEAHSSGRLPSCGYGRRRDLHGREVPVFLFAEYVCLFP